jgi:hypothetical protein
MPSWAFWFSCCSIASNSGPNPCFLHRLRGGIPISSNTMTAYASSGRGQRCNEIHGLVVDPTAPLQRCSEKAVEEHAAEPCAHRNPDLAPRNQPARRGNRAIKKPAAKPATLPDLVMPPSVPAGTRFQVVMIARSLPGIGRFRWPRCRSPPRPGQPPTRPAMRDFRWHRKQPNRARHGQIGQHLPCAPAFPAFGESERLLAAVSQARGRPGHGKQQGQRCEGRWTCSGKKQETGEAARQRSRRH